MDENAVSLSLKLIILNHFLYLHVTEKNRIYGSTQKIVEKLIIICKIIEIEYIEDYNIILKNHSVLDQI